MAYAWDENTQQQVNFPDSYEGVYDKFGYLYLQWLITN